MTSQTKKMTTDFLFRAHVENGQENSVPMEKAEKSQTPPEPVVMTLDIQNGKWRLNSSTD